MGQNQSRSPPNKHPGDVFVMICGQRVVECLSHASGWCNVFKRTLVRMLNTQTGSANPQNPFIHKMELPSPESVIYETSLQVLYSFLILGQERGFCKVISALGNQLEGANPSSNYVLPR